jgi:hypothetical protein
MDGLDATGIAAAFAERIALTPPLSAGLVWLDEGGPGLALSDYARTGIVEHAMAMLQQSPFTRVAVLPTTAAANSDGGAPSLDAVRSAAAKFQYDVAFVLQTGTDLATGWNAFSVGYLGLVTAPLFPGTDLSVAAGAELCAVDVRSGIMLGCGVGRARAQDRFVFPFSVEGHAQTLRESVVSTAIGLAATDVLGQIAQRVAGALPPAVAAVAGEPHYLCRRSLQTIDTQWKVSYAHTYAHNDGHRGRVVSRRQAARRRGGNQPQRGRQPSPARGALRQGAGRGGAPFSDGDVRAWAAARGPHAGRSRATD